MRSKGILVFFLLAIVLSIGGIVQAQTYHARSMKKETVPEVDDFEQSVDLARFRRGNFEWDTQELVASGFKAVHRDSVQMAKRIEKLENQISELKNRVAQFSAVQEKKDDGK